MAAKRDYHVIPSPGGGWSVRREGAQRSSGVFDRQSDAIAHARELARDSNTELVVHGKDGRIRDHNSNGPDHSPVKGHPQDRNGPKGFGSIGDKFIVRRGIDVTKPIYEQTMGDSKKRSGGDRTR